MLIWHFFIIIFKYNPRLKNIFFLSNLKLQKTPFLSLNLLIQRQSILKYMATSQRRTKIKRKPEVFSNYFSCCQWQALLLSQAALVGLMLVQVIFKSYFWRMETFRGCKVNHPVRPWSYSDEILIKAIRAKAIQYHTSI